MASWKHGTTWVLMISTAVDTKSFPLEPVLMLELLQYLSDSLEMESLLALLVLYGRMLLVDKLLLLKTFLLLSLFSSTFLISDID